MIGDSYIKVIDMSGDIQITHVARAEWIDGTMLQGFNAENDKILHVLSSCVSAIFIQEKEE